MLALFAMQQKSDVCDGQMRMVLVQAQRMLQGASRASPSSLCPNRLLKSTTWSALGRSLGRMQWCIWMMPPLLSHEMHSPLQTRYAHVLSFIS
ncbi:hypothetical protein DUNSADRAFT_9190 [Dunaliella salina]|uniref:Uncharacterized protein n=1 Tax=Dunaliella salina TaxID=3046 RepID=A0ABQ7GI02_DUNSA|nr:hypothetical protein DUNSADRAFT_9190 [Dunaliella salina]|eukprot:KAF5834237.1 hypothetical protein DUNSADRAFT_9190 [Dunaliella salina]